MFKNICSIFMRVLLLESVTLDFPGSIVIVLLERTTNRAVCP